MNANTQTRTRQGFRNRIASGRAVEYLDESPCRGCSTRQRCADDLLACRSFVGFVGRETGPERGYQSMPREPNPEHYAKVFSSKPERARWLQ